MQKGNKKVHLVNLFKWRSTIALIACLITIFLTSGSVIYGILTDTTDSVQTEFRWFTIDSNILTAFAALMILPFAIDGILKKRFTYPKWMLIIHYQGTICTTLTMIFVLCFISWYDPHLAFGEENFFLHIICPLAVLISFFMVESNHRLTKKETLLGLIPFTIYSVMYFYNVVITKRWDDLYQLNTLAPFYVSLPLMLILAYGIALIIRLIHNYLSRYRERKMKQIWDEDLDPVTIKIEVYSLGVHSGMYQDKEDLSVPFDILEEISKKFDIRLEELANAYIKGSIDGMKQKKRNGSFELPH